MAPCMGPMSPVRAYSLWAGLCPEKLVKTKKLKNYEHNDEDNVDDDNNDYVYFDNEENGTDVIHHSELSKEMKIATLMPVMLCRVDTVQFYIPSQIT